MIEILITDIKNHIKKNDICQMLLYLENKDDLGVMLKRNKKYIDKLCS